MNSICITIFFVFVVFVITSEANNGGQINDQMPIDGGIGGYKIWLNEVTGYDINDPDNGYAGILGKPITSLRISGGKKYRSHVLGDKWYGEMTGNDQTEPSNGFSGTQNGDPIDAITIDGGNEYAVHILGGNWTRPISGYDINKSNGGYAGTLGNPIDAIMIKGRTYAVSINEETELILTNDASPVENHCANQGGTCMNTSSCNGLVLNQLCSGETDNYKCCVPNVTKNDGQNNSNIINIILTVTATLVAVMIIAGILICYYRHSNKNDEEILSNYPDTNNINYPNNPDSAPIDVYELPPPYPYPELIEEGTTDDLENKNSNSPYKKNDKNSQRGINSIKQTEKGKKEKDFNDNLKFSDKKEWS